MFTGIIQDIGKVINFSDNDIEISTTLDLNDCKIGSSICCNGVCLTVTEINFINEKYYFKSNVSEETKFRTSFSENSINQEVPINLEKSLKIGDEISGHFVYGHIDCTTKVTKINKLKNSWEFFFENFKNENKKFIVEKGSIAIHGISLTIANEDKNNFSVSIVPHTFQNTNLKYLKNKNLVNVEFDYLARYSMKDKHK